MSNVGFREGCEQCKKFKDGDVSVANEGLQIHMIAHAMQDIADVRVSELRLKVGTFT